MLIHITSFSDQTRRTNWATLYGRLSCLIDPKEGGQPEEGR